MEQIGINDAKQHHWHQRRSTPCDTQALVAPDPFEAVRGEAHRETAASGGVP
ncbi:hypothetical protein [Streptomyces piniterrae]|uniref:hypothetical protein n=1 Tax=Streptomyces piniterrae TaxID=2571125 RepID=UPI00145CDCD5|nr:hypothetical protein [Streptomyces piniterrae]